ncbi:hypothetical protein H2203_008306 [Taxawa tesnikishii (nom. ined.)]|nr:hypothetical protein H2203_008306 [Dothideales sp. JES 119]
MIPHSGIVLSRSKMPRNGHPTQTLSLLALFAARIAAGFPYNPTRIFLSQQDDRDIAYVFQPNGENGQFLSLEISKFSSISNLPLQTLYSSLPFTDSSTSTAFTPFLDESGNITVLAGDCTSSANGAELWRFTPDAQAQNGNGSWSKETVSPHDVAGDAMAGSNFLGAGVAFSEMVGGGLEDTSLYMFAGMCPTAGATVANWITAATYSNFMVTLAPEDATEAPTDYKLGLTSTRGPPIAEAGFSMTALPALSGANTSSGQTQQQNFVLLGGHTQTAFINMSQVALFSLPQENWAFLPVDQPSSAKTDLAKRDAAVEIEPRSGHTAVLSEDGKSIIVVGGWVGDVTTAATPQLAVLQLGSGYGGDGDWEWSVPDQTGVFASLGAGLYGHGAVMLPGGVVMIMGGYTISSSASRLFRRDSQVANTKSLFYNVTSNTWLSSYDPPATVTATSAQDNKSGALTSSSQKAGLAAGLTLGFVIVVCLLLFYFWYTRRLGARRDKRASDMRHLVNHSHDFDDPFLGKTGIDGRGGDIYAADVWDEEERAAREHPWLPNGQPPPGWKSDQARAREVERTGLFVNIPSPTRGLRRGLTTRNNFQYHAAPRYDESRTSRHSGNIHPIEEIEEEALSQLGSPRMSEAERKLKALEGVFGDDNQRKLRAAASILSEDAAQDPFRDPLPNPLGSHPVSPDLSHPANANIINTIKRVPTNASHAAPSLFNPNAEERENLANWVSEWSHAGGLLRSATLPNGRVSPTKTDDRTSSTLSEQSNRSNLSANSIARTASTRTAAIFGASTNPFASPQASPSEERTSFLQSGRKSPSTTTHAPAQPRPRPCVPPSRTSHPNTTGPIPSPPRAVTLPSCRAKAKPSSAPPATRSRAATAPSSATPRPRSFATQVPHPRTPAPEAGLDGQPAARAERRRRRRPQRQRNNGQARHAAALQHRRSQLVQQSDQVPLLPRRVGRATTRS